MAESSNHILINDGSEVKSAGGVNDKSANTRSANDKSANDKSATFKSANTKSANGKSANEKRAASMTIDEGLY